MTPDLSHMLPLPRLRKFLRAELAKAPPVVSVETIVAGALKRARQTGYRVEAVEVREETYAMVRRSRYRGRVAAQVKGDTCQ